MSGGHKHNVWPMYLVEYIIMKEIHPFLQQAPTLRITASYSTMELLSQYNRASLPLDREWLIIVVENILLALVGCMIHSGMVWDVQEKWLYANIRPSFPKLESNANPQFAMGFSYIKKRPSCHLTTMAY